MSDLQLSWTEHELLATAPVAEPLIAGGRLCHGGFDADGTYVTPRTLGRNPAVSAWQQNQREIFGTEIVSVPLDTWPETYPNVAQSKYLLTEGVCEPVITNLTRIGTVEGFGAVIRYEDTRNLQRFFADPIEGTALGHLGPLFEAHARDEAGHEEVAGHKDMWFAARDIAFESPAVEDQMAVMLQRIGIPATAPTAKEIAANKLAMRVHDDLDPTFESMIRRMLSILFIEISAFHTFAWAEAVLSDENLVAGSGEAARLVSYIRADETPHVEYLKTVLTEIRDRTLITESGGRRPGKEVVETLWKNSLSESLGARRTAYLKTAVDELQISLMGNPRRDSILEGFHELGTFRPDASGEFAPIGTY